MTHCLIYIQIATHVCAFHDRSQVETAAVERLPGTAPADEERSSPAHIRAALGKSGVTDTGDGTGRTASNADRQDACLSQPGRTDIVTEALAQDVDSAVRKGPLRVCVGKLALRVHRTFWHVRYVVDKDKDHRSLVAFCSSESDPAKEFVLTLRIVPPAQYMAYMEKCAMLLPRIPDVAPDFCSTKHIGAFGARAEAACLQGLSGVPGVPALYGDTARFVGAGFDPDVAYIANTVERVHGAQFQPDTRVFEANEFNQSRDKERHTSNPEEIPPRYLTSSGELVNPRESTRELERARTDEQDLTRLLRDDALRKLLSERIFDLAKAMAARGFVYADWSPNNLFFKINDEWTDVNVELVDFETCYPWRDNSSDISRIAQRLAGSRLSRLDALDAMVGFSRDLCWSHLVAMASSQPHPALCGGQSLRSWLRLESLGPDDKKSFLDEQSFVDKQSFFDKQSFLEEVADQQSFLKEVADQQSSSEDSD